MMKNIHRIKLLRTFLVLMLIGGFITSCSDSDKIDDNLPDSGDNDIRYLSLLINKNSDSDELRSIGNPEGLGEDQIYSLEVLVFKSGSGELDGNGSRPREINDNVSGQVYDKEYIHLDEIVNVAVTAGKRDIYVIANAPDNYFADVIAQDPDFDIDTFKEMYENLETQGLCDHPPGTNVTYPGDEPIGGINPTDLKTNLTMVGFMEGVEFNNQSDHHYLGYDASEIQNELNAGGHLLKPGEKFYVERLVARIAIREIKFDFQNDLTFETGNPLSAGSYEYAIDTVFLLNSKVASYFVPRESGSTITPISGNLGHGDKYAYDFLKNSLTVSTGIFPETPNYLMEPVKAKSYDYGDNTTHLWFYTFENDGTVPTYLIIGVRYDFIGLDGKIKTVKHYYPVMVNKPDPGKSADHDYIKRNYQYGIKATIENLGQLTSVIEDVEDALKSAGEFSKDIASGIEVEETVEKGIFSWN